MVLSFRDVFSHSHREFHWLFDLHFLLPTWAVATVNLAFGAYLIWVGAMFYRIAQGKERLIIAGWSPGLLSPIKYLLPTSAAAILYVETVGTVVAFLTALYILLQGPTEGDAHRPI